MPYFTDATDDVLAFDGIRQFTGGQASGLIPTRYPGSESSEDSFIRLARKTEWTELAESNYQGLGQRLLATNVEDYALMDIRKIELNQNSES